MDENPAERVISFIDLGTNSVRLLIVRLNPNFSYSILRQQKDSIRLGEKEFRRGKLDEDAIEKAVDICRNYTEISSNFGLDEIIAVATSAAREASNGKKLIKRLKNFAGIDVKIISGTEEARLIYLGVSSGIHIEEKNCLFIDIGGGSTELIVGNQIDYHLLKSIKIGALRTTEKFGLGELTGPVSGETLDSVYRHVKSKIVYAVRHISEYKISDAYGSSGTILSLTDIAYNLNSGKRKDEDKGAITINDIEYILKLLSERDIEERKKIPGLNPDRADIIIAGCIILHALMKESGIGSIKASDRSLRDGLLADYLLNQPGFSYRRELPVRDRSVRQLGKSCRINEAHANDVVRLSCELFDTARKCGLHSYGKPEREYLRHAAYLHDIGQFISFSRHQQHTHYIITNAPLLGFNESEINIIGLIARHHRKKMPKKKDPLFNSLDEESIQAITILSLFLRFAEHMERSHDGRVKHARLIKDGDGFAIEMESKKDCTLEVWALEEDAKIFEKIVSKKLMIVSKIDLSKKK